MATNDKTVLCLTYQPCTALVPCDDDCRGVGCGACALCGGWHEDCYHCGAPDGEEHDRDCAPLRDAERDRDDAGQRRYEEQRDRE